jgi:hypothetical protein
LHIISLIGFKGSGKDTVAKVFTDECGFTPLAFADSLKDAISAIFCWDREMMEGETQASRVWRETVDPWWAAKLNVPDLTPRWVMQNLGTEVIRTHFNPDIWRCNVERRILDLGEGAKIVITDGRFPNELDLARRYGSKIVRVRRGPDPDWYETAIRANETHDADLRAFLLARAHESEWAWIGYPINHLIENDAALDDVRRLALSYVADETR